MIGAWRQMPPQKQSRSPMVRRPSPKPPGFPVLSGYTQAQAESLGKDAAILVSMVKEMGGEDPDLEKNGGTGKTSKDATSSRRKASGSRQRKGLWGSGSEL